MFAIVRTGGKQYKVAPGDVFEVERLKAAVSSKVVLDEVLLVNDGDECIVGAPTIKGAGVECTVMDEIRGPKIKVFKFKAKKRYRRMRGHRQELTVLRVDDVRKAAPPARKKARAASKTKSRTRSRSSKSKAGAGSASRRKSS